jgi:uncharacterized protein YraI
VKKILFGAMTLVAGLSPALAQAAEGYATANVNMRSGPSTSYPAVTVIPNGTPVEIHGCLADLPWCDVSFYNGRGWVAGRYVQTVYQRNRVYLEPRYYRPLGIPTITFSVGNYWDRYYRDRPFYRDRERWDRGPDRRPDRRPDRVDRDGDRPDWARPGRDRPDWDRDRDRDRDQARDRDRDRNQARERERDREQARDRDRERDREQARERNRERDREQARDRNRDRDREQARDRDRNRDDARGRDRDRNDARSREGERERNRPRCVPGTPDCP